MTTPDLAHVSLRDRPLVVCDIDEVALEFISPFTAFLRSRHYDLLPRSFRLHGNIISQRDGKEAEKAVVDSLLEGFFASHDQWQTPAKKAVETLNGLAREADIVFLTAMPPRHHAIRRTLLDRLGLPHAMIATEEPKGPIVAKLHGNRPLPVAFLDDIDHNLISVRDHLPQCLLISLMANEAFRSFAPAASEGIHTAQGWDDAAILLREHFRGDSSALRLEKP